MFGSMERSSRFFGCLTFLLCTVFTGFLFSCQKAEQSSSVPLAPLVDVPATQPAVATQPVITTQPVTVAPAGGDELLQSKASMPGYGVEAYRIVNGPDEIVSVLRNGTTVICKRVASPVAAVRGYVGTGGIYEGKWLGGGLSHLLEHLVAGGSSERRTEAENRNLLQRIGNDSNAYTTYDHTAYFVNTTTPHFQDAVDLVTGWMLGALITEPEYRREYQVVQRELERDKGNPDYVFWHLTETNRYQVNPARVPVIGYQEVIQGLKRDDVYSYYKLAYQPNNMIFSVAANLPPEEMLNTVRGFLADYKPGRVFSHDIAEEPPVLGPRTLVATFAGLGQARLNLAFPSVKQSDPDMYALDLLGQMLGGGESSILSEQIRDKQQLCSGIIAVDDTPAYALGSFDIEMQLDAQNVGPATAAVLAEIEKIKSNGVDEDRLQRAKAQMKIARLKGMQTSQDVAASLALDYYSCGDIHFSDLYVDRIEAVTAAQLQAVVKKYLDQGKLLTTVMLPREAVGAAGLPKAEDLLRAGSATTQASETAQADSLVTRTVLSNGLIVLHRRITTTPLVSINLYSLGGLTAEDKSNNGIGNLAMSLLRRGTTSRSAEQIADFFDLTGGDLSATCENNWWSWKVTSARDEFSKTMDVFADVVNHPTFDAGQLEHIRKRALAAIDNEDASWDDQAFHYFKQQYFGPANSPLQFLVIGSKENVSGFSDRQLRDWYEQKVRKSPQVLAIFGDVDKDDAIQMAEKYFGQAQGISAMPKPPVLSEVSTGTESSSPMIVVDRVEVQKTSQPVAGVVIGFESASVAGETDEPALTVAQCLTGGFGYPTGYIFEILRGRGLVYEAATINAAARTQKWPGAFIAYAGCDPKNVNEVVNTILENVARLQGSDQDIQVPWFNRCKDMITTYKAMQTETPAQQAEQASRDELYGLGYDYESGFAGRIDGVQLASVRGVAGDRLRKCVVTICTPNPERVEIKPGEKSYASFPTVDLTPRGVQHDVGAK